MNKSYLKGRYQKVTLVNVTGSRKYYKQEEIKNGVTQGSIFGPSFFLFYINDLPKLKNKDTNTVLFEQSIIIIIIIIIVLIQGLNMIRNIKPKLP